MAIERTLKTAGITLDAAETHHIHHTLDTLDRRLARHPEPRVVLVLTRHHGQRLVEADLRVQLTPLGGHLISHQAAESADHAVRLAVQDVERQLERRHASQRGEPSFGVPSRRLPAALRPSTTPPLESPEEPAQP